MPTDTLIRLFEATRRQATCRGCNARIEWFTTLAGKQMPMNAGAVLQRQEIDPTSHRVVGYYTAADSHWATCPTRDQFKRGRG